MSSSQALSIRREQRGSEWGWEHDRVETSISDVSALWPRPSSKRATTFPIALPSAETFSCKNVTNFGYVIDLTMVGARGFEPPTP